MNRRTFLKVMGLGGAAVLTAPVLKGIDLTNAFIIPKKFDPSEVLAAFYRESAVCSICSTDYEGELRNLGDAVVFRGIPDIKIHNYRKGMPLRLERPVSAQIPIVANRATRVPSGIGKKFTPEETGRELAHAIDRDVFKNLLFSVPSSNKGFTAGARSRAFNLGRKGHPVIINKHNMVDYIVDIGSVLDENNVPRNGRRWVAFPSDMIGHIMKRDLKNASIAGDGSSIMRNGRIGILDDLTIFKTDDLVVSGFLGSKHVLFGNSGAIAFAAQIKKGQMLYGHKVIKKEGIGELYART